VWWGPGPSRPKNSPFPPFKKEQSQAFRLRADGINCSRQLASEKNLKSLLGWEAYYLQSLLSIIYYLLSNNKPPNLNLIKTMMRKYNLIRLRSVKGFLILVFLNRLSIFFYVIYDEFLPKLLQFFL